jgi:RNA polymerase sigma-70 factor, ECF subfamily
MAKVARGDPKSRLIEEPEIFDVALLRAGDEQEWRRLVEQITLELLLSLQTRGLGSEADDIIQETFFRVVAHFPRYDPSKGTVRQWIFGIAKNERKDVLRLHRDKPEHGDGGLEDVPTPGDVAGQLDLRMDLEKGVARLSAAEREAWTLHRRDDMPFDEAAAIAGRSPGAMKMASSRADRRLREYLK